MESGTRASSMLGSCSLSLAEWSPGYSVDQAQDFHSLKAWPLGQWANRSLQHGAHVNKTHGRQGAWDTCASLQTLPYSPPGLILAEQAASSLSFLSGRDSCLELAD